MPCATPELQREYQRKRLARTRAEAVGRFGGKCCKCGSTNRLEFDHIDRAKKSFNISNIWSWRAEIREAELSKCQLLCRDCHAAKTAFENGAHLTHGMRGMYDKGCRCDQCMLAKRQAIYAWRIKVGGRKAPPRTSAGRLGVSQAP